MTAKKHLSFLKMVRMFCGLTEKSNLKYRNKLFIGIYTIYSIISAPLYLANLSLMIVEIIIERDDPIIVGETLSYITLYVVMYISLLYIESKNLQELFHTIDEQEKELISSANGSIKEIHEKYAKTNNTVGAQIFAACGIFCFCLAVHHIGVLENKRNYIFYQWLPFNPDNYYWIIVIDNVCYLSIGFSYMMYTKLATISISTYILSQVNILQHFLLEIEHYTKHIQQSMHLSSNDARFIVLKECVIYHNSIIKFVNAARQNTNIYILLDFALTSFQLASVLISLSTGADIRIIDKIVLIAYFVVNIKWMWETYYYGNEIIVQSLNISVLIYTKLNWHYYDKKTKKGLSMIMNRAQKPLSLSIGPLADLSLQSFLTVLRATFSYLTFMTTMYE